MASEPTFNLESFVGGIDEQEWAQLNDPANNYPLNNRAIVGQYPPGSTFKVITAMAALQDLGVTAYSPFYLQPRLQPRGSSRTSPRPAGGPTAPSISPTPSFSPATSSSTISVTRSTENREPRRLGDAPPGLLHPGRAGVADRRRPAQRVRGQGADPAVEVGVQPGATPTTSAGIPGDTVNMAVGQGDILVTPLQLANVYAAIANRGPFYRPHVGKEILTWQGETDGAHRAGADRRHHRSRTTPWASP